MQVMQFLGNLIPVRDRPRNSIRGYRSTIAATNELAQPDLRELNHDSVALSELDSRT